MAETSPSPLTDDSDKEPVAGLSAASACIRFSLALPSRSPEEGGASSSFRPVYTHQSFEGECLPGWRPLPDAERESRAIYRRWGGTDEGGLHPSYQRCGENADGLDVHVILAPSCDGCRVEVRTEKIEPTNDEGEEPAPKRKKVSFGGEAPPDDDDAPKQAKMDVKEVVRQLSRGLPPIDAVHVNGAAHGWIKDEQGKEGDADAKKTNESKESAGESTASLPVGRVLKTYQRQIKGETEEEAKFVLALADGADPATARYHHSIQPPARWFIETADSIDVADASRGSWKVLYLFRCHGDAAQSSPRWSLAGYITLLHVTSPFHKPRPGVIVRICQALILPPYHRAGHGSEMLQCIHEYAGSYSSTGMGIVEVNVEDPAPAFVALRDAVDYRRFRKNCGNGHVMRYMMKCKVTDKEFFLPVPEEHLLLVAEDLRITKRQAQIVYEMYKLEQVERWKGRLTNGPDDEGAIRRIETAYRLMVKKSLRSLRIEELGACGGDKEKQKTLLAKWFDETLDHYRRVVASRLR